jgi:hypothetical protein
MNAIPLEIQIRFVGVLCFVLAADAFWLGSLKIKNLPGGYTNPVLALELVACGDHIDKINKAETSNKKGETVRARDFISKQLKKDTGFIVLYVLFLSSLGLVAARLTSSELRWAAIASVGCAVLAGILDLVENRGMRKALGLTDGGGTNALANMIRYPSLGKWALIYIFSILIGITFIWGRHNGINPLGFGFLFLLGGVVGLSGVIANLYQPQFYRMFPLSQAIMAVGSLWVAVAFIFCPALMISSFNS